MKCRDGGGWKQRPVHPDLNFQCKMSFCICSVGRDGDPPSTPTQIETACFLCGWNLSSAASDLLWGRQLKLRASSSSFLSFFCFFLVKGKTSRTSFQNFLPSASSLILPSWPHPVNTRTAQCAPVLESDQSSGWALTLPLSCCVTLEEVFHLSTPLLPHPYNEIKISPKSWLCYEYSNESMSQTLKA